MTKLLIFAIPVVLTFGGLRAQTFVWQPSPEHTQAPIWPGAVPDAWPVVDPEVATTSDELFGGRLAVGVSESRVAAYNDGLFAQRKENGRCSFVFPGGGYQGLAIDLEGTDVCDWLTPKGITCVLLKYRVPGEKLYPKSAPYPKSGPYPRSPIALEDAQRTLRLAFHASEWHIDPHKIGVLGFSAGGHLSVGRSPNPPCSPSTYSETIPIVFSHVFCSGHLSWASVVGCGEIHAANEHRLCGN